MKERAAALLNAGGGLCAALAPCALSNPKVPPLAGDGDVRVAPASFAVASASIGISKHPACQGD